jgi:PhzF family phenazine biosynthesis protein
MRQPAYFVDAFESGPFTGNPAAVCPLDDWLDDRVMQAIAAEHNLSETAFFVGSRRHYDLRWFTPEAEVDLCGHATLASAHVLLEELGAGADELQFLTRSGTLVVERGDTGLRMRLPAARYERIEPPAGLIEALGADGEVFDAPGGCFVVLDSAEQVAELAPDLTELASIDRGIVCVTAGGRGEEHYVSRVFAPSIGIDEDPATGSAHCALAPYWGERLGLTRMHAVQLSKRGGDFICEWTPGDRHIYVAGTCRTYLRGEIEL